jgi:hypothetical protein
MDQERRNRISQLNFVLASYVRDEGELPRSLEDVNQELLAQSGYGTDLRRDPETGEPFEYRRLSDREYEVCATFQTSSEDRRSQDFGYPNAVTHKAGRNCFDREISDQDVESAFSPNEGLPRPVGPKPLPPETERPTEPPPPEPSDPAVPTPGEPPSPV